MPEPTLPQLLARTDAPRFARYRQNLAFYQGKQWSGQGRPRERRLTFNYARTLVEKVTSYLMQGVSSVVDPVDGSPEAAVAARRAEQVIRETADANGLDALDFDTEIDCAVLGDAAYRVTWDAAERQVLVTAPDPQGLYAWWRADDPARLRRVAVRYEVAPGELSVTGVTPRNGARNHVAIEDWTDATFDLWVDGRLARSEPNPYGLIPFVIYPNLREPKRDTLTNPSGEVLESVTLGNQNETLSPVPCGGCRQRAARKSRSRLSP